MRLLMTSPAALHAATIRRTTSSAGSRPALVMGPAPCIEIQFIASTKDTTAPGHLNPSMRLPFRAIGGPEHGRPTLHSRLRRG